LKKKKLQIKVFNSHRAQEIADTKFWRNLLPNEKRRLYEDYLYNYLMLEYGKIPRLQRVFKIIKRKKG